MSKLGIHKISMSMAMKQLRVDIGVEGNMLVIAKDMAILGTDRGASKCRFGFGRMVSSHSVSVAGASSLDNRTCVRPTELASI